MAAQPPKESKTTHTAHDDTARTWRDLTDQLTPSQVEKLAEAEKQSPLPDAEKAEGLRYWAREHAERNLNDQLHFGHLPRPEGATQVYGCGERTDGRGWSREFTGTVRRVGDVSVYIEGAQYADGTVERRLAIAVDDLPDSPGGVLNTDQAHQLAALLSEAADELDRLDG